MLRAQVQSLRSHQQQLKIQQVALERDVHQIGRSERDVQAQWVAIEQSSVEMTKVSENAQAERITVEQGLQETGVAHQALEARLGFAEQELIQKESVYREQEQQLHALRVDEASVRERVLSLKKESQGLQSLMQDRSGRLREIQKIFDRATQEQEQFSGGEFD